MRRRWRRVAVIALAIFALISAILGGLVAYAALTLPSLDDIGKGTGTIKILDRAGRTIAEVGHNNQKRTSVNIDQIAPSLRDATVAAEDRNFYTEGAFDVKRVAKALVIDVILRRPAEGASTITQQLAKQAFFGADAEKSALRKLREALLANQIAGKYSKDQILQMYLNITYYGENAYGVEDASQVYFGKHAKDLNLSEAALLAGLPEAPSANNPNVNPNNAFKRMHYVLIAMVQIGKASQADAQAADPLNPDGTPNPQHQAAILADLNNGKPPPPGLAPHFVRYVQDQLTQIFNDFPSYLNGNLVVTTTLNLDYQFDANKAISEGLPNVGGGANNSALLMMEPHSGDILAMVGSANYADPKISGQYNITTASLQPGSSFKPYVYETGFKNGTLKPDTILQDTRAESQQLGGVNDYDHRYLGNITAATALTESRNIPTEQAMQKAGPENVVNFAHSLGISSPISPNLDSAIGDANVTMLEHTAAYAAFANTGHKVAPRAILKVQDDTGSMLRDFTHDNTDQGVVMTPQQSWSMTQILRHYASRWNLRFKWDTAGKSGTTNDFKDAWYMVYTPDWVTATWTGHTDGATQTQVGMDQVFGTDQARHIAVPFVNLLPKPAAFQPVAGALSDCSKPNQPGCPTPTPTPSATPSPTPEVTPTATPTATDTPTPTPTASPCPTPAPPPSKPAKPTPPVAVTPCITG